MFFQVASDLHIEKLYPNYCEITDFITVSPVDNLILAGDIGSIYHYDHLKHFFVSCKTFYKNVIYVPGNNEYYSREGFELRSFTTLNNDFDKLCEDTGVLLLNNSYIELETCIIFGSTWWSYIPDILNIRVNMEDGHRMNSDDFNYLHATARRSLNWIIEHNRISQKHLLVISHYCPTRLGTMNSHHRREDFDELIPYYFSSSEKYLQKHIVNTWIFGHTHVFRDFLFNRDQTRIISNADPRKKFFRKNFVFEFPNEYVNNFYTSFTEFSSVNTHLADEVNVVLDNEEVGGSVNEEVGGAVDEEVELDVNVNVDVNVNDVNLDNVVIVSDVVEVNDVVVVVNDVVKVNVHGVDVNVNGSNVDVKEVEVDVKEVEVNVDVKEVEVDVDVKEVEVDLTGSNLDLNYFTQTETRSDQHREVENKQTRVITTDIDNFEFTIL